MPRSLLVNHAAVVLTDGEAEEEPALPVAAAHALAEGAPHDAGEAEAAHA